MDSTEIRKRINRVCLAILVFIDLLSTLQTVQIFAGDILYSAFGEESAAAETIDGILVGVLYLIAYFVSHLIFKAAYSKDYISLRTNASLGSHPVAMIFASLAICFTASHLVGYFSSGDSGAVQIYHDQGIVVFVFTTVLIPAFCEELFFRGLIMTNLMPLGRNFAIIASGIIFGLIHGNHDQILFATVAGIVFGWLYAETGTIWCGVLAHMLNNFIAVIETVLWGTLKTGTAVKLSMIIEAAVLICGVISIIYLIPRLKKERKEEFEGGLFGKTSDRLLDGGRRFTLSEYIK